MFIKMQDQYSFRIKQAPIFIVGTPRSGTTLAAKILNGHPDIISPGESHFFEDIWTRREAYGSKLNESNPAIERTLTLFGRFNFPETQSMVENFINKQALIQRTKKLGGTYADLYCAFMTLLAEANGKSRFCDDTPKHLYHLPAIFEQFPRAKVIVCVRDPRDFLCSYKNYWQRSTESERVKALYHPVVTSLLWRSSANLVRQYVSKFGAEQMMILPYEQLVQNPAETVQSLCQFIGVYFQPELLNIQTHNSSFQGEVSGIFSTSVGRWKKCLQPEEVWLNQHLVKDNLIALGYQLQAVKISVPILVTVVLQTPFALWRGLKANSAKRGPIFSYLSQRVKALF